MLSDRGNNTATGKTLAAAKPAASTEKRTSLPQACDAERSRQQPSHRKTLTCRKTSGLDRDPQGKRSGQKIRAKDPGKRSGQKIRANLPAIPGRWATRST
ncbi:MAG TPA: hypothetical protein ENJ18_08995 [Nannocystis exedens]|nr:hypothetical protein [Nannocystis exedens]